ncbi:MAG TPA: pilus assembly protein TadG-related protein [Dehalococcoidia bacterium]|nr:pilus assembly protein TadG-related protein [Dehalococcoidia bacterium]
MSVIRGLPRRLARQRGQVIILFVGIFTVIAVIGAITVDFGLWFSERRGAQKDADLAALAGAWELLKEGATETDAVLAAQEWLDQNNQQGNASFARDVRVDSSCFAGDPNEADPNRLDSVTVDVDHESRSLFASIFELAAPGIGAHARACAGAALTFTPGITEAVPFEIDVETSPCFTPGGSPIFTKLCGIEYGAQGGPAARGLLDLEAPEGFCSDTQGGANNADDVIANGVAATCNINSTGVCDPDRGGPWKDCVSVQSGNPQKVVQGTHRRILREQRGGVCDPDNDGIHQFEDVVTLVDDTGDPLTSKYQPKDCDPTADGVQPSPRIVTIIVLEDKPGGNSAIGRPIYAFAGFYLAGCASEMFDDITDPADPRIDRKCTPGPGGSGPSGHVVVYGRFVNLITAGTGVTTPNTSTTLWGISLVE